MIYPVDFFPFQNEENYSHKNFSTPHGNVFVPFEFRTLPLEHQFWMNITPTW